MDSVNSRRTATPNFTLSPHQQDLLIAALNSKKSSLADIQRQAAARDPSTVAPTSLNEPSLGKAPDSGILDGLDDSPFIDYDYDFDADAGFDFDYGDISQGQMIGKLPGSSSDGDVDTHDKRSHPDDEGNDEEGGGKRREGDDRSSKKPGRKPLTSEPTSVSAFR
jgi:AP-1-like factor